MIEGIYLSVCRLIQETVDKGKKSHFTTTFITLFAHDGQKTSVCEYMYFMVYTDCSHLIFRMPAITYSYL